MKRLICWLLGHDWYGYSPRVCGRCYRTDDHSQDTKP